MSKERLKPELIAPCGINCMLCLGYLRTKKKCPGCRNLPGKCKVRKCKELNNNGYIYCHECNKYPCRRLQQLDLRYRTNYNYSNITTLEKIRNDVIGSFLIDEEKNWVCSACGGIICTHRGYCSECGKVYHVHEGNKRKLV
jgi:hypothetical protein